MNAAKQQPLLPNTPHIVRQKQHREDTWTPLQRALRRVWDAYQRADIGDEHWKHTPDYLRKAQNDFEFCWKQHVGDARREWYRTATGKLRCRWIGKDANTPKRKETSYLLSAMWRRWYEEASKSENEKGE